MNRMLPQLLRIAGWLLVPFVQFGQAPSMGVTSDFALFTSVGNVSDVSICNVIGDIGSNFGTNSWSENVNGVSHQAANATTTLCALDLSSLYGQLNGTADVTVAAALGAGQTILPGVTRVASNATMSGNLFLDAQGDENAVFIIRVEGTFNISALSQVRLVNGANACNVFWRIENDLTMMNDVQFFGTVACNGDIVCGSGSYVSGRLLTQNGSISITQSRIFVPSGCGGGPILGPTPPDLGDVSCFVFFSSDGQLSNSGASIDLTGDVGSNGGGTDPSTTGFTGFNGSVEFMNSLTVSGASDLSSLYNDLQISNLAYDIELVFPADCGNGLRLTPQVYLLDANTTVTDTMIFDAQGTDRAIFVVQVNGTLDIAANAVIQLLNSARSANIFWIVEGNVNIAVNAEFKGTIIADLADIVIATGTIIEGRVLTEDGDVTWSGTTGTLPTDGSGPCGTPVFNISPMAGDDFEELCENSDTTAFNVQANDIDPDLGTLTTSIVSGPTNGFAEVDDDMIHYIPNANFSGNDTIVYAVCDNGSPSLCDTALFVITVNDQPTADAGPDQLICAGDTIQIGTAAIVGHTYSWTPSATLGDANDPQPLAFPVDTTTYVLTITRTATGCTNIDSVVVNVKPFPTADAGADVSICSGDSTQIGSANLAGHTYAWTPTANLNDSTISDPWASPTADVDYIVTVTNTASTCSQTDTISITVNPLPVANAGSDQTICSADSVQIGSAAAPGRTYSWSPSTDLDDPASAMPWASPSDSTQFVLQVTMTATGCVAADTVLVHVNPSPNADAGSDVIICEGDSTQIGATAAVGIIYNWSPGTAMDSTGLSNPTVAPISTTTYVVTATDTLSGCQSTDTVVVTVNPVAAADAGPDQDLCSADSVQIGSPAVPGNNYSWSPTTGLSSSTAAMPWVTVDDTTTYVLTVSSTTSACQRTDTVTVNVGTTPFADAGPDQSACDGDAVQLGTPAIVGVSYSWSPSAGLDDDQAAQPMADPIFTTQYVLTVTDDASGCQQTDTVIVSVGSTPSANAGPDRTICDGESAPLGTLGFPTNNYYWSPGDDLNDSTIAQPTASPADSTEYVLTVIQNSSGCRDTDTVMVFVNPQPIADAGVDQGMCLGEEVTIGSTAQAGYDYSWSPSIGLADPNASMTTASPLLTTQYVVTVTDDDTGCSQTDTVIVTVTTAFPPEADAGPDRSICAGDSVQIGTDAGPGLTYAWSPASGLSSASIAEPMASPADSTEYILTVEEGTSGCDATDTVWVNVSPVPVANAGADQFSCGGETVQLGGSAMAGYSYSWSPSAGLSDSTSATVTAGPATTTTYTLTVTDTASGCSATDVVVVSSQDAAFYSGFSPNGDSYNDTWTIPVLECYPDNKVEIVNRWGSRVWVSDDYDNDEVVWDGKNMNDEEVPDGTYYYTIRYNDTEQRGWVFVKR